MLLDDGIAPFADSTFFMGLTALLVFIGSIGFIVWFEVANKIKAFFKSKQKVRFSLHTKIVLVTTASLMFVGTIVIWFLERHNTLANTSFLPGCRSKKWSTPGFKKTWFIPG